MEDPVMGIGEAAVFSDLVQSNGKVYAPPARGVGRPSTVAQYTPQISQWLREKPVMSGAEVLRRVRSTGYRGGKSALYELVRRLRLAPSGN
jgi:hypothetical protein